jgi:hypothetical protein
MAVVVVVTATPKPLPTSKAQLCDLHNLSRLAKVKVIVMVTVTATDRPSTIS